MTQPTTAECIEWVDHNITYDRNNHGETASIKSLEAIRAQLLAAPETAAERDRLKGACRSYSTQADFDAIATSKMKATNAKLLEALKTCKATLESDNPGICDTIWLTDIETLVDRIDAAIAEAEGN